MDVFENIDLEQVINNFLKYCEIDYTNLTDKEKLTILINKKMGLDIDVDISYQNASTTNDINLKNQFIERVDSNQRAIDELNICIYYLRNKIKNDKKNNSLVKKIKSLLIKK